jgi:adenosylhomocysteine nucleosidase
LIAIIAALRQELAALIEKVEGRAEKKIGGLDATIGRLEGAEVALASCGIGKVKAAAAAQALIDAFAPRAVWCIGLAGALTPELKAGDVVVANELYQHDFDLSGGSRLVAILSDDKKRSLVKCDASLVEAALNAASQLEPPISPKVGLVVTGDCAVLSKKRKRELAKRTRALCVEMEGAAVGQVCARNGVPFVVIRGVSDSADANALLQFAKNSSRVARAVQSLALQMLKGI